jgi:hypothetical protein
MSVTNEINTNDKPPSDLFDLPKYSLFIATYRHLVWNGHPDGGLIALGTSPSSNKSFFTLNLFEEHKKLENEISQIGGLYSGRLKIAAPLRQYTDRL